MLRAVLLAIGAGHVQAGTDGAMPHYFEQQLVPGTTAELRHVGTQPVGTQPVNTHMPVGTQKP